MRRFRTGFECCSCSQCWCRLLDLGKQCSDPSLSCQMESCCLVAFQVCPAGFNLKATLGINVVSWFLIPYFSWPKVRLAASLYRHAHGGFTVLTSASANCELHLLPPKKKKGDAALSISGQIRKQCVRPRWLLLSYYLMKPSQEPVASSEEAPSLPRVMMILIVGVPRIEIREFWGHSCKTLQLELKTAAIGLVSSAEGRHSCLTSELQIDARLGDGFKHVAVNVWLNFNCFQSM